MNPVVLAATIIVQVTWHAAPTPPPKPVTPAEWAVVAAMRGPDFVKDRPRVPDCRLEVVGSDGERACVTHAEEDKALDADHETLRAAMAATPVGGCAIAVNDPKTGKLLCALRKGTADQTL